MNLLLPPLLMAGLIAVAAFAAPASSAQPPDISAVLRQTGAGLPSTWGVYDGKPVQADYDMDPEILRDPKYAQLLEPALKSLPSLMIQMSPEDLFDPARGIYANPTESGADWERKATARLTFPEGRPGFDVPCGIRIQGGWNRRPVESPKHSFRLVFKRKYGAAKLRFPLFDSGAAEFDSLVLRGGNNNSWLHWSGEERARADFLRDQWMRDSYRAMGRLSSRGLFVNLYLNNLYWGLYNLAERPDPSFLAGHLGGAPGDYDSRNADKVLSGDTRVWERMFALANGGLGGDGPYAAIAELIDIPAFIDYMVLNFYGANDDWDRSSNWYAARRREPSGKFIFMVWDAERTLEQLEDNRLTFDDDLSPPRLFQKLRENKMFRAQFSLRAAQLLGPGGVLCPDQAASRFDKLASSIELAVVAESARWGDYRRDVLPYKTGPYTRYTREDHWRPEINRLMKDYFPKRSGVVLEQFRQAGLADK